MTDTPSWEPFGSMRRVTLDRATVPSGRLSRRPAQRLIVLTCMDARLDPLRMLGLRLGDAHVLRNAGATATDDVLRSIHLSHVTLGTERVVVVGHTDCAAHGSDPRAETAVRAAVRAIARAEPGLDVTGAIWDLDQGELRVIADSPQTPAGTTRRS